MGKIILSALIFLGITLWSIPVVLSQENVSSTTCNELLIKPIQEKAVDLMKSEKYDEAALLYKKITVMCPDNAGANMDYGSTLFASASKYFDRNREPMFDKDALPILEEAAVYLKKAISLFGNDKESIFWKAHAYYLIGDIYHYGLLDLVVAEKMYRASLSLNPDNAIVRKELEDIQNKKIKDK